MPTLPLQVPSLVVAWTSPTVLAAAAAGVAVVVGFAIYLKRGQASSGAVGASQGSPATPEPSTEPSGPAAGGEGTGPANPAAQTGAGAQAGGQAPSPEERDPTPDPPDVSPEELAQGTGRTLAEMAANEEVDDTELISRFVHDMDGSQVGETMTIDDGEVILKRDGEFFSVPPDAIIEKSGTLLADANIDWDEAREAGEAWEDENLDRMEYDDTGMPKQG